MGFTARTLAERTISRSLFEPLFEMSSTGQLRGVLAQDIYTQDGKLLTIQLKPGIRLHNLEELTVNHVITHLQNLAKPNSGGQHIVWPILGATEVASGVKDARLKIRKGNDPYSLVIELSHPYAPLPRLLASLSAAVIIENHGTGPFFLN